jgi:hypothetical protein
VSDEKQPSDETQPKRGFWATVPRGSFGRVTFLLLLLATVVYLQRRSGEIAGCASRAFNLPPPPSTTAPVNRASSAGTIRARVQLPDSAPQ